MKKKVTGKIKGKIKDVENVKTDSVDHCNILKLEI